MISLSSTRLAGNGRAGFMSHRTYQRTIPLGQAVEVTVPPSEQPRTVVFSVKRKGALTATQAVIPDGSTVRIINRPLGGIALNRIDPSDEG